jgi:uncharacterized protein YndB with AHSA1/START domain
MNERATLIQPSTVRFERLLPGPIERVWAYLVESEKRATWLAAGEFDLRLGGRIELHFENHKLTDDVLPPEALAGGMRKFEGKIRLAGVLGVKFFCRCEPAGFLRPERVQHALAQY